MAHRFTDLRHGRRVVEIVEFFGYRLERQRHVGTGIAVGNRVDIQPVDDLLMASEEVAVDPHQGPYRGGIESFVGRHRG